MSQENPNLYSKEKAMEEASIMQDKISSGEEKDYKGAEDAINQEIIEKIYEHLDNNDYGEAFEIIKKNSLPEKNLTKLVSSMLSSAIQHGKVNIATEIVLSELLTKEMADSYIRIGLIECLSARLEEEELPMDERVNTLIKIKEKLSLPDEEIENILEKAVFNALGNKRPEEALKIKNSLNNPNLDKYLSDPKIINKAAHALISNLSINIDYDMDFIMKFKEEFYLTNEKLIEIVKVYISSFHSVDNLKEIIRKLGLPESFFLDSKVAESIEKLKK